MFAAAMKRSSNTCSVCGVIHNTYGQHDTRDKWWKWVDIAGMSIRTKIDLFHQTEPKRTRARLATTHIDNDLTNDDPVNITVMCQRHFLQHIQPLRDIANGRARWNRQIKRGQLPLIPEDHNVVPNK